MPSPIKKILRQKAVYWSTAGVRPDGQPKYGPPVEIKCRWVEIQEEFVDSRAKRRQSRAKVYVDRDLVPDGVLRLGTLDQTAGQAFVWPDGGLLLWPDGGVMAGYSPALDVLPFSNKDAYPIGRFEKLPDFRAQEFLRTVYL